MQAGQRLCRSKCCHLCDPIPLSVSCHPSSSLWSPLLPSPVPCHIAPCHPVPSHRSLRTKRRSAGSGCQQIHRWASIQFEPKRRPTCSHPALPSPSRTVHTLPPCVHACTSMSAAVFCMGCSVLPCGSYPGMQEKQAELDRKQQQCNELALQASCASCGSCMPLARPFPEIWRKGGIAVMGSSSGPGFTLVRS